MEEPLAHGGSFVGQSPVWLVWDHAIDSWIAITVSYFLPGHLEGNECILVKIRLGFDGKWSEMFGREVLLEDGRMATSITWPLQGNLWQPGGRGAAEVVITTPWSSLVELMLQLLERSLIRWRPKVSNPQAGGTGLSQVDGAWEWCCVSKSNPEQQNVSFNFETLDTEWLWACSKGFWFLRHAQLLVFHAGQLSNARVKKMNMFVWEFKCSIHVHTHRNIYIYICMCICICICICIWICIYVYAYVYIYICIYKCVSVYLNMYMDMYVYLNMYMYMDMYMYASVCKGNIR